MLNLIGRKIEDLYISLAEGVDWIIVLMTVVWKCHE